MNEYLDDLVTPDQLQLAAAERIFVTPPEDTEADRRRGPRETHERRSAVVSAV